MRTRLVSLVAIAVALALGAAAGPAAAAPTKKSPPLKILVTNDDGVGGAGIIALVTALRELPNTKIYVSAPAANQSGTGGKTTPGTLDATPAAVGGVKGFAVNGFPADSVNYALDGAIKAKPDVVLSGINAGQNLGTITDVSGTVGAARAAASRGIPALASSQGIADVPDYAAGVKQVLAWVKKHRKALVAHTQKAGVENLNIPTCVTGKVRGLVEVPLAANAENAVATSDCASTLTNLPDDIQAFNNGYATLSPLSTTPAGG